MKNVIRWYCWLQVIGVVHMFEQVFFGLDELQELKGGVSRFQSLFSNPDVATVLLVIGFYLVAALLVLGPLLGRRYTLWTTGFFGLLGLGEAHHFLRVLAKSGYNPGCVTAVAFVAVGWLLLRDSVREYRKLEQVKPSERASFNAA